MLGKRPEFIPGFNFRHMPSYRVAMTTGFLF
jgi:hypothetical protein